MAESEHSSDLHLSLTRTPPLMAPSLHRYVWLVPRYTRDYSAAAVGFEVVIQGDADGSLKDLAKGAGGDFRYILPIKDVTKEAKVTHVALLRREGALRGRPMGWVGNTTDINKNRGKTFLYLLWKLAG